MTCVVTEACIACRYGDCVDACPVDAFRVGENFVVIDPEVCVNCTVCVPACPVSAIVADYELDVLRGLECDIVKGVWSRTGAG